MMIICMAPELTGHNQLRGHNSANGVSFNLSIQCTGLSFPLIAIAIGSHDLGM